MRPSLILIFTLGTTLGIAAPPGAGRAAGPTGRFASGPISGPAPVGASGPAPVGASGPALVHAAGSLLNSSFPAARTGAFRVGPYPNSFVNSTGNRGKNVRSRASFPLVVSPYAYPYLGYDDSSYAGFDYGMGGGYGPPPGAPDPAQDLAAGQDALGQQLQQLTAEVEQLRAQQGVQAPPYALQPNAPTAQQESPQPAIPLTLVLVNGQQVQVNSYAVMDGVFWDFSKQPARRIPLSSINVDASAKATQQAGGDFPDLTSR